MSIELLRLMQIADSAVPIGAASHSFGIETLTDEGSLTVERLPEFLEGYLAETGALDASWCRAGWRLARVSREDFTSEWTRLSDRVGARKPAREGREASAMLGRRLLQLVDGLSPGHPAVAEAVRLTKSSAGLAAVPAHHAAAFGLAGAALRCPEDLVAQTYLQQNVMGLVSACQRLLPLGQSAAGCILWDIKPALIRAAAPSEDNEEIACFTPSIDLAGMRHPWLTTRLFIS
ncbi:urease accessory protein UreF [Capsulimonas corticalis]|uniref:Urease accessory protein UreF n=2 Tax=Capsulimonas corticalis TaxID=2219043 RepID=A0A402D6M9_9BACT|nr:urease accessory protein UreF [Capsulimonas corticalis]